MSRPIYEPTSVREDARLSYGVDQLFRRPASSRAGRFVGIVFPSTTVVAAGDDAAGWFLVIPQDLDELFLIEAQAAIYTVSSSGLVTVQVRNVTQSVDMLSTKITIDVNEHTSYTAATPPVINLANAQVDRGDIIVTDVDNGGTGAEGLDIILAFA